MKSLAFSFLICTFTACIAYFILKNAGLDNDLAKTISILIMGGLTKLHELVEKTISSDSKNSFSDTTKTYLSYKIHPALFLIYASVSGYVALSAGSFFSGLIAGMIGSGVEDTSAVAGIILPIFSLPILFLVGLWIGRRCRDFSYWVAFSTGVFIRIIVFFIEPLLVSKSDLNIFLNGPLEISKHFVYGSFIYSVFLMLGVVFGKRQQLSSYFNYLMDKLPKESRIALVELAYDETVKLKKAAPGGS